MYFNIYFIRNETEVSILRAHLRLRNQPARAHPSAPPGHQGALSLLPPLIHAQQHGAPAHCARTPSPGRLKDAAHQVWADQGSAGPELRRRHAGQSVAAMTRRAGGLQRSVDRRRLMIPPPPSTAASTANNVFSHVQRTSLRETVRLE